MNYAIHDLIEFQIKKSAGPLKNYFDTTSIQFQNFTSENNLHYDFYIEIRPFARANRSCTIIDDTYYIANNYFYYKDRRKLSKWEVEISEIEKQPIVKIATNFVGNITTPLNIVEFFIQYCLLKKGISVIHASGIGKGDKCVMFPARSGGGKTTVALSFLDRGFSYFGDNFILLDKGIAKNYISPLNIFTYNRLPIIEKSLNSKQKFSMFLKKNLYAVTGGHFKIFEKINPTAMFNYSIANNKPVYLICILEVNNALYKGEVDLKHISRQDFIKKSRYNMELDLIPFSKLIYSYGYMFPNSIFSRFWEMYEEVLERNLPDDIPIVSVEVPLRWTDSTIDKMVKLLNQYLP